ncbi:MAG: acyl--CoA ligase [Rhizobiaceae bacterium]|nr:acyl--CoA ligase [Rhizobiaceae bacterium]
MTQLTHTILTIARNTTPRALAATLGDDTLTFDEAWALTARYVNALRRLGVRHGDRVAVQAEFRLEQIGLFFATQYLGAVFAPLNPAFSPDEVERAVAYLKPALLVQDAARAAAFADSLPRLTCVHATFGSDAVAGSTALAPLLAAMADSVDIDSPAHEDEPQAIYLTSGSTGQPKGVVLTHRANWMRSHLGASRFVSAGGRGELLTFPMFHWAGWNYLLENWAHKRAIHFVFTTSGDEIARAIIRHDPAFLYAIPAIWERILASKVPFDGTRLRSVGSGTSKFDPVLMERIAGRFPRAYRGVFYGSTEFGGACSLIEDEIARRPGAVGLPSAGHEARIVDGELQLRGPTVMSGYFELPEQTAEVLQDGWYRTGDLVELDEDGFISITGRAREVIRSGGETIAPAEVELALRDFPGLRGVAIVGLDDPTWGEIVCAVAEIEAGAECPQLDAIRAHLQGRVAAYKHPRRIVGLAELPRTPATGQIMRSRIKQIVQAAMA